MPKFPWNPCRRPTLFGAVSLQPSAPSRRTRRGTGRYSASDARTLYRPGATPAKRYAPFASQADPAHALAQYQLGMTALNLGQIQDAVNALEAYLKIDPNGPKAAEVKASLPALQGMLKK